MRRILTAVIVTAALTLVACGGDDSVGGGLPDGTGPSTPTTASAMDDPGSLGDAIGLLYVTGYGDVVDVLEDRPDAASALPMLVALKEAYVQQMVAFGQRREVLDADGRAVVDARISSALLRVPTETFEAYSEAASHYASDTEVADLIGDFNIIGQYANFDLLREQSPEEAARLGVG